MVGSEYSSTFTEDSTDFDESKASSITKGVSTQADIVRVFGAPTQELLWPAAKSKAGRVVGYRYLKTARDPVSGKFQQHRKSLQFEVNESGVVINVDFSSTTPR